VDAVAHYSAFLRDTADGDAALPAWHEGSASGHRHPPDGVVNPVALRHYLFFPDCKNFIDFFCRLPGRRPSLRRSSLTITAERC
jgi:hypothetical protein